MSLFPAYKSVTSQAVENGDLNKNSSTTKSSIDPESSWLRNTSFTSVNVSNNDVHQYEHIQEKTIKEEDGKIEDVSCIKKKKKKKKKKSVDKTKLSRVTTVFKQTSSVPKILESDQFYEDKKQERGNLLVDKLHRPAIPRYDTYSRFFILYRHLRNKQKKKRKVKRYFTVKSNKKEDSDEEFKNDSTTKEAKLTKFTEDFNKRLDVNPGDVSLWLDYVNFQDTVYEFEKTHRRNPLGGERVTCERKLAIVERAIKSNQGSERLLAERLELIERLRPTDQLAEECKRDLTQDPGNLILWRTLIRTTRNSMARCVAPGVLQVFSKAISRISQLRLHRPPSLVEKDILHLMLECGLFLQQAGLWEQLWMLLQMYISLNLTASGQFHVPVDVDEDNLRDQEDAVIASGLPLSVLWMRVEKLRAAYHFLPQTDCDSDPQRVVFSDDMAGLLQPVMSGELRLRLVASVLVLLKIPLLPTRHTVLSCMGLLDIPSATNNAETLLAALYPTGFSALCNGRYLSGAADLINDPQFTRDQPGQPVFLSWVVSVMKQCAELLPTEDAVIIHSWTLRFNGLLCCLHSSGLCSVPSFVSKQAKSHAKQLLKLPQFRNNLLLYTDYAMIERDAGDLSKACKVLETAASMPGAEQDVHYTMLCRRLVECLMMKDYSSEKSHAVRILISLGNHQSISSGPVSEAIVERGIAKWEQETMAHTERYSSVATVTLTVVEALTPQMLVEWLTCHALLLFLTRSVWEASSLLQHHIQLIPHSANTLGSLWVEQLYEVLVDILYLNTINTKTSFTMLRDTLTKAISCFPNNLSLLNVLASLETRYGGGGTPLWKLVSFFPPSVPLARLILVFVVRCRISSQNSGDNSAVASGSNYLKNLLQQLTQEKTTNQCPMVWRLYLQLVAATDSVSQVKSTFYKCLQACPWVKAFYLDAVKFLPEEVSEVQDLLIEKELRLHTSPEELEILRS